MCSKSGSHSIVTLSLDSGYEKRIGAPGTLPVRQSSTSRELIERISRKSRRLSTGRGAFGNAHVELEELGARYLEHGRIGRAGDDALKVGMCPNPAGMGSVPSFFTDTVLTKLGPSRRNSARVEKANGKFTPWFLRESNEPTTHRESARSTSQGTLRVVP